MGEWSFWCFDFNCWAWWSKEFQGLIAGMLAIVAGSFAFGAGLVQARAARAQASAMVLVAADDRVAQRRAAAAALYAELTGCETKLISTALNIYNSREVNWNRLPVRLIETPIFDANPAAVGLLEPDDAAVVVQAYSVVDFQSARHGEVLNRSDFIDYEEKRNLAKQAEHAAALVKKALIGLQKESGINPAKATAMREGYERARKANPE